MIFIGSPICGREGGTKSYEHQLGEREVSLHRGVEGGVEQDAGNCGIACINVSVIRNVF